jgi:hypothetical protein
MIALAISESVLKGGHSHPKAVRYSDETQTKLVATDDLRGFGIGGLFAGPQ